MFKYLLIGLIFLGLAYLICPGIAKLLVILISLFLTFMIMLIAAAFISSGKEQE